MNGCFELRFNVHRCGIQLPEDAELFSRVFSQDKARIEACLGEYETHATHCAQSLRSGGAKGEKADFLGGKKILFVGDSITSDRMSYFNILRRALDADCIDGAISGAKSADALSRIRTQLAAFQPDILSLLIGTNDAMCADENAAVPAVSLAEYERNLRHIVEYAKEAGVKIILMGIPPIHEAFFRQTFGAEKSADNALIRRYNEAVRNLAQELGICFTDTEDLYEKGPRSLFFEPDGVHLSPFAQQMLAKRLFDVLLSFAC